MAVDAFAGTGHIPRTGTLPLLAAGGCVLVGGIAVIAPAAALALVIGIGFLLVTFRSLPAGLGVFTLLIALDEIPGLQSGVTFVKLAGGVLVAAWLAQVVLRRDDTQSLLRERPLLSAAAAGLVVWALASSLWADDQGVAISSALRLSQGVVLLFVVYSALREPKHVRWLLGAYVGGTLVAAAFALASFSGGDSGRLGGANTNPNELAAAILPAIMVCAFAFLGERRPVARWAISVGGSMLLLALLMTGSRGGLVGLAVALVAAVVAAGPGRLKIVAAALVIIGIGIVYYATYAPQDYVDRLAAVRNDGGTGRSDLWEVALVIADDRPVTGVGAGNFPVAEARYAAAEVDIERIDLVLDKTKVVHNVYLSLLSELGSVGLGLFLCLVLGALASIVQALRRLRGSDWPFQLLVRGFLVGVVAIMVAYTFTTAEYEKQLWLLLGVAFALPALAARVAGATRFPDSLPRQ